MESSEGERQYPPPVSLGDRLLLNPSSLSCSSSSSRWCLAPCVGPGGDSQTYGTHASERKTTMSTRWESRCGHLVCLLCPPLFGSLLLGVHGGKSRGLRGLQACLARRLLTLSRFIGQKADGLRDPGVAHTRSGRDHSLTWASIRDRSTEDCSAERCWASPVVVEGPSRLTGSLKVAGVIGGP